MNINCNYKNDILLFLLQVVHAAYAKRNEKSKNKNGQQILCHYKKLIIHPWSKNIWKEIFNIVYTFAWKLPYWKNFYRKQAKQL